MKVEDAEKKICPLSLNGPHAGSCIIGDCMAWEFDYTRVVDPVKRDNTYEAAEGWFPVYHGSLTKKERKDNNIDTKNGYYMCKMVIDEENGDCGMKPSMHPIEVNEI